MDALFKFLNENKRILFILIFIVFGLCIFAVLQGREVSFWPPKIGPVVHKTFDKEAINSGTAKSRPQNARPLMTKEPKDEGKTPPTRQKTSNKDIVRGDYDKQQDIPKYRKSKDKQNDSVNMSIDYESETNIINNLSIDKKITIARAPKQKYRYSCPDFHPDAVGHFTWLSKCEINKFGSLGTIGNRAFYFGLYKFICQQSDYLNQGVVIFEGDTTNDYIKPFIFKVHLDIFPQVLTLGYSEPRIFNTEFGKVLALSCALGGGSAPSYDNNYFFWNGSNWIELNSKKWESELERKLPKGLSTVDQLIIDLNDLTVTSDLWTAKDAHCCPTGGKIKVYLSIKQNMFAIDKLKFL